MGRMTPALDAVPETYHILAAVWWALAPPGHVALASTHDRHWAEPDVR
jgi:hypothetical protein